MAPPHRLLTKDPDTRRATCSECGPDVAMFRKGAYWRCAKASSAKTRQWQRSHQKQAAGNREASKRRRAGKPVSHELVEKDMLTLTGQCVECGQVDLRRLGRGWVCENRTHCRCWTHSTEDVLWFYNPSGFTTLIELCESCCKLLARGFVAQGLMEPVLELTWPEYRVTWDQASWELEQL